MLLPGLMLTALAGLTSASGGPTNPTAVLTQDLDEEFEALEKEFDRASLNWRRARRNARKEGATFDEPDPLIAYFPRFDELARRGSAPALAWVGLEADKAKLSKQDLIATKRRVFGQLVEKHPEHAVIEDFVKKAARQRAYLETKELAGWLERILEKHPDVDVRARAAYEIAQTLSSSRDEKDHAAAEEWCRRIVKDFPGHKMARRAQESLDVLKFSIGRIAPDFTTQDVDGNEFKLSDYRGKVVVLDFWGFW